MFSWDTWAAENGCVFSDEEIAKWISAAMSQHYVLLKSDFPVAGSLPGGVLAGNHGDTGVIVSWKTGSPFKRTLHLVPKVLRLGIGCRRGIGEDAICCAVDRVLDDHCIDRRAISHVASIDLKADEEGLLNFCRKQNWPIRFYSSEKLETVKGSFSPSDFVRRVTGVDNVCERAAMVAADRLIVKKTVWNGVTVAVAAEQFVLRFE